jgi:hypothetical protein
MCTCFIRADIGGEWLKTDELRRLNCSVRGRPHHHQQKCRTRRLSRLQRPRAPLIYYQSLLVCVVNPSVRAPQPRRRRPWQPAREDHRRAGKTSTPFTHTRDAYAIHTHAECSLDASKFRHNSRGMFTLEIQYQQKKSSCRKDDTLSYSLPLIIFSLLYIIFSSKKNAVEVELYPF